jgi:hypothetical protein
LRWCDWTVVTGVSRRDPQIGIEPFRKVALGRELLAARLRL